MKGKSIIFLVVVLVLLGAAWYAYKEYNRENADVAKIDPSITIDAASLIKAFEQNSDNAMKTYIDKTLEVNGTVNSVDTSGVISLGPTGEMSSVQCSMDKRHVIDFASVKEGAAVTIKGKCTGYESQELLGTDVKMNFCVLDKESK